MLKVEKVNFGVFPYHIFRYTMIIHKNIVLLCANKSIPKEPFDTLHSKYDSRVKLFLKENNWLIDCPIIHKLMSRPIPTCKLVQIIFPILISHRYLITEVINKSSPPSIQLAVKTPETCVTICITCLLFTTESTSKK